MLRPARAWICEHSRCALIFAWLACGCTAEIKGDASGRRAGTGTGGGANTEAVCSGTSSSPAPFRVMTRLNRAEYDNTVRDLLGDTGQLAQASLPADYGDGAFDNNAAALTIDPALVEKYVDLAQTLAERALA